MPVRLGAGVSDMVCTVDAHLSCYMLGMPGMRVVMTVINGDDGGGCQH